MKFDADLARDGDVEPVDKALYAALSSFVDPEGRDTLPAVETAGGDVPTRKKLAACIGRSVDTVDRATARLEARGLLRVERQKDPDNPKLNVPSTYELLDYVRWDERAAERAARRSARQGGGRMDAARGSRTGAARGSRMDAAVKEVREVEEEKEGESAVTPRSGADGRRPSTGSSVRASGSAASGKDQITPAEGKLVAAAIRELPYPLQEALPVRLPAAVKHAVLEALAAGTPQDRSPQQLVKYRILPKWWGFYDTELEAGRLGSVLGAFQKMLRRDQECGNPRCDERTDVDTGYACGFCVTAKKDRAAARKRQAEAEAAAVRAREERPAAARRQGAPAARQAPSGPALGPKDAADCPEPPGGRPVPTPAAPIPIPIPAPGGGEEAGPAVAADIRASLRSIKSDRIRKENHRWRDRNGTPEASPTPVPAPF